METPQLIELVRKTVLQLIEERDVRTFLFGSASGFDSLCLKVVMGIKAEHPEIKLIYVRSHFSHIDKRYRDYLLESYDETFMPPGIERAGRASYAERNQAMITASDFCVFYYNEDYNPPVKGKESGGWQKPRGKSGTRLAYEYARQKGKESINLYIQ